MIDFHWTDLLRCGFELGGRGPLRFDCGGIAERINVEIGTLSQGEVVFPEYSLADTATGTAADFLAKGRDRFERLGARAVCAQRIGDFAVTDPDKSGCGTHLVTLVDLKPRTWLTAILDRGILSCEDHAVVRIVGVYRVVPR